MAADARRGARWVALWLTSLGDGEKIEIEKGKFDFAEVLEITEVIPMREGVAYRMVFRKHGYEISGLIDLSEANTVDSLLKTVRYSESFARIVYAVPF